MALLSIYIPTFNRAAKCAAQLSCIIKKINELRSDRQVLIELFCSDNCSVDGTWECLSLLKKTNPFLGIKRQPKNLGLIGNCIDGLVVCSGKFIWICGDDDDVSHVIFPDLLELLERDAADVGLVHLNCFRRNGVTGVNYSENEYPSFYLDNKGGPEVVSKFLEGGAGVIMWLSGNIVLRSAALEVVGKIEWIHTLLGAPALWNSYCGAKYGCYYMSKPGPVMVTHVDSWSSRYNNRIIAYDLPMIRLSLANLNIDKLVSFNRAWLQENSIGRWFHWGLHLAKNKKSAWVDLTVAVNAGAIVGWAYIIVPVVMPVALFRSIICKVWKRLMKRVKYV